jgi:tetratricopeptide (TPR) repeat protein
MPFLNRRNNKSQGARRLRTYLLVVVAVCAPMVHGQQQGPAAIEAARLNNLGTALMGQQFLDRAVTTFADAAKVDPSLTLARINEGIALLYLQKSTQAEPLLAAAAAEDPKDPHSWYALGLLYRNQNQPEKALDALHKVSALKPGDPDTHYMIASVYFEINDLPHSKAEFERALELDHHHASAIFGLARELRREGDATGAQKALARFQHVTSEKLGTPLSHNYGEEGIYARVEDAALAPTRVEPMIPVTFNETWHSEAVTGNGGGVSGAACLIDLSKTDEPALIVMGKGEEAVRVYDRRGSTRFALIPSSTTGIHLAGIGLACAVGDFDNDGLTDVAFAIMGSDGHDLIALYRNLGDGRFEDATAASGIAATSHPSSLTFVDYDHDGDLDLFVTGAPTTTHAAPNTLWRNNGNKTFTDWTKQAGLEGTAPTTAAILSDLNNDRAVDLLVAGKNSAPTFFSNNREGPFGSSSLFAASLSSTVSVTTLDFNKDGWMDVLLSHAGEPGVSLWRNVEGKSFERVPLPMTGVLSATSAIPIDFDNDGWIDIAAIVQTRGEPELRVLRNLGPAGFEDVSAQLKLNVVRLHAPRSLLADDVNHSGASDLIVTNTDGSCQLFANVGGNRNHSLHIQLHGGADNKSGIGTKIQIFANGLWQKWEDTGQPEILAGVGSAEKADLVRLLWPTGVPQDEIDVASSGMHPITETDRRGSSCPTLFAWNGSHYSFITDVIGAAVIGHWVSPTRHNIPDPDEWIKVDGDQLRARNGLFSLRFGEPMEEVNFVDQVRLVAIDHPAGAAVFPNEGFLSEPPFAKAKTIVASAAHPLAGAWDDHGNNVLPLLSQQDVNDRETRNYVRDFTNLPFAGFANRHSLTVEIGAWTPDHPLHLLLHGFIEYFSASSMYSAWQAGLKPIPPYVEAQMPDGSWHKIIADMGFPAGLPRTVTVDLTGKLPIGVTRLRITTNLQIYWDQALVDNEASPEQYGDPSEKTHTTELALAHATLAFRGYPQQLDGRTPGDLTYNYQRMSASGPFVPHTGAYTRYGDVTPLLHKVDDKFVVFGTGEDMDLEFSATALPALPKGWSRDYFFYANGFVKDMDFYEAKPFSVGSLPFHGMSTYPYPANEHYPTDADHTAYQLEYNTRFESGSVDRSFQFDYVPDASKPEAQR